MGNSEFGIGKDRRVWNDLKREGSRMKGERNYNIEGLIKRDNRPNEKIAPIKTLIGYIRFQSIKLQIPER